jgi:hypothetical protein
MTQISGSHALMMEAASTSETLVNFCQITRRNNLAESHIHTDGSQNEKSPLGLLVSIQNTLYYHSISSMIKSGSKREADY